MALENWVQDIAAGSWKGCLVSRRKVIVFPERLERSLLALGEMTFVTG